MGRQEPDRHSKLISDLAGSTEMFDQTTVFQAYSAAWDSFSHLLGLILDIGLDGQLDFFRANSKYPFSGPGKCK